MSCNLSPHAQSLTCWPLGAEWRTRPQDSPCHSFHLGSQAGERVAQHTAPCFLPPGIPRPARLSRPPGECRHKASSVSVLPVWQGQARRREGGPGEGREEGLRGGTAWVVRPNSRNRDPESRASWVGPSSPAARKSKKCIT